MTNSEILKKIAYLEFVNDQLTAELSYVDDLLRSVGFPNGLKSAKEVALDVLEEGKQSE